MALSLEFVKMHGIGNDFVLIDCLKEVPVAEEKLGELSEAICMQHFGVGSDGLILVLPDDEADYRMRMWNPDGSESEMCGNGIRCFAKYLFDAGHIDTGTVSIATARGLQQVEILEDAVRGAATLSVRVDMDMPRLRRNEIPMTTVAGQFGSGTQQVVNQPLEIAGTEYFVTAVSMGNPHVIIFVNDVENVPLKEAGFKIEHHEAFPERTNVHFVQILGPQKLWMRSWERGAGDTLACGTGACAAVVASALNNKLGEGRKATVCLPGGDLEVEWAANNRVYMTGDATTVFTGELNIGAFPQVRKGDRGEGNLR